MSEIKKNYDENVKKSKSGNVAGLILIVIGAIFLIAELLILVGVIPGLNLDWGDTAAGVGFCIFGVVLMKRRVRQYGWGIAALVFLCGAIGVIDPFDKYRLIGSLVLCAVFSCLLLKANMKR